MRASFSWATPLRRQRTWASSPREANRQGLGDGTVRRGGHDGPHHRGGVPEGAERRELRPLHIVAGVRRPELPRRHGHPQPGRAGGQDRGGARGQDRGPQRGGGLAARSRAPPPLPRALQRRHRRPAAHLRKIDLNVQSNRLAESPAPTTLGLSWR